MASKVAEADAGVHTLSMAVAVSAMPSPFVTAGLIAACSGPFTACNELASLWWAHALLL